MKGALPLLSAALLLTLVGCSASAEPDISAEKSPSAGNAPAASSNSQKQNTVNLPVVPAGQGDALK